MPTKSTSSFQQFVNGLFGNISGTQAAKPSSYQGPYAPGYSAPSPSAATTSIRAAGTSVGGRSTMGPNGPGAYVPYPSGVGGAFTPYGTGGTGGMSSAPKATNTPNATSAATGKPVYGPDAPAYTAPAYTAPVQPAKTTQPSTQSTATSTGSTSAAPATAPAAAAGSYSAPSGFTSGSSTGTTDYRKAYTDMLSSLYSADEVKSANESLNDIRRRAADARLNARHEETRIRENDTGQGLKSYNGQLSENSRKSSAELADLAIAGSPFEEYIKSALSSAKDVYGVGRDEATDARQAAQDKLAQDKFDEDKRQYGLDYALRQQSEARLARTANKPDKATKQDYVGQYAAAFTPGNTMADGTPTVDQNGYITPKAFKEAAAEAAQYGITRKEFIELFGSMLYTDKDGMADKSYGLTPVEKKLIAGTTA